ncbi:MAG: FlgD immunoglobulin-like domain containing protein [bacterium]
MCAFPESLETEHFLLLYTTDSSSVGHADPAYVQEAAGYLEQVWNIYEHDPRFEMPPAVGSGPTGASGNRLVKVYVEALSGAYGYATWVDPIPGRCPNAATGELELDSALSDFALRRTCAHELFHVFCYGIDAAWVNWIRESTATWAEWTVWPDFRDVIPVLRLFYTSQLTLWEDQDFDWQRMYGAALFWQFLEDRLGEPVAPIVWKALCDAPWRSTTREVLQQRYGRDLDGLVVEFWRWNVRAGYADDGAHYRSGAGLPHLPAQAVQRTFGPEPQSLPDSLVAQPAGTNLIVLHGPSRRENLHVTFDGAPELAGRRAVTLLATTWPNTFPYEVTLTPDASGDCIFDVPHWELYDEVALLVTNYESAADYPSSLGYRWSAEEAGPPVFDVAWGLSARALEASRLVAAPNPFAAATQIRYRADAAATTSLDVYDVAGRHVRALVRPLVRPVAGDYLADWDGTDDAGAPLPAGVYFLRLGTAKFAETRRIGIVR